VIDTAARFVLTAAREPDDSSVQALRSAAVAVTDWGRVSRFARLNNVAALVSAAAERVDFDVPRSAAKALRVEEVACIATTIVLDHALTRVLVACADRSVPAIVLKGPVLARTLYPVPALRPYADLDLVVRRETAREAGEIIRGLGFHDVEAGAWARHAGISPFHRGFIDRRRRTLIELHTDPLQLGLDPRDEDGRWSRAVAAPGLGGPAEMLGDSDQLIHLSVHAHKHGFSRLIWLKDIDLLIRRPPHGISWSLVCESATKEGVSASVWYALQLAHELLGTPLPPPARALLPRPALRALYRRIWSPARVAGLQAPMRRRAVQFDSADSWRGMLPTIFLMGRRPERVRLLARHLGRQLGGRPD